MPRSNQSAIAARSVSMLVPMVVFLLVAPGVRTAGAQTPSNPCAQVTAAEVSAALGETVEAGQQANAKTCSWTANKPKHQIVSLMYWPPNDWNKLSRPMSGVTKAPVSGVGDAAFAQTVGNFGTLFVKKGSTIFMVRVYGEPNTVQQLAIEKVVALKVAAKV